MKNNQPVTANQVKMKDGEILVSRTNLKGIITYCNEAFIKISGFDKSELIGKNHNVVRHPDMPTEAFEWLWRDIKQGLPWKALVKNRCKNGDYYWVEANVTPIYKNGQIVEYLSVRQKPSEQQIAEADALYRQINAGKVSILKKPWWQKADVVASMNLGGKFAAIAGVLILTIFGLIYMLASEMQKSITFTEKELAGVTYIKPVRTLLQQFMLHRGTSAVVKGGDQVAAARLPKIRQSIKEAIQQVDVTHDNLGAELKVEQQWAQVKQKWNDLLADVDSISSEESFQRHSDLVNDAIFLISRVGDSSNLILDPELDSFYLMDVVVVKGPELVNQLGILRGLGSGISARGEMNDAQRIRLISMLERVRGQIKDTSNSIKIALENNSEVDQHLHVAMDEYVVVTRRFVESVNDLIASARRNGDNYQLFSEADELFKDGSAAIGASLDLYDRSVDELTGLLKQRVAEKRFVMYLQLGIVGAIILVVIGFGIFMVRRVIGNMKHALNVFSSIGEGNFNNPIDLGISDESGEVLRGLQKVQVTLLANMDEVSEAAAVTARVKIALDNVSSNVMVADSQRNIIYCNKTVVEMFRNAEADIQQQLPNFDSSNLLNTNIDQFHRNPKHQADLLASFTDTYRTEMVVGGRTMRITANPVIDEHGNRLGAVVEWEDRTAEVEIEQEIEQLVSAARSGNLDTRLALVGKTGFMATLAENLNGVLEVLSSTFKDVNSVMRSLSSGDLKQKITSDYEGVFGEAKENVNSTIDILREIVSEIRSAADDIVSGSNEISTGNNSLSSRTEQQASALEETAASMEELNSTVDQNAQNTKQADELASGAVKIAERGGDIITNAVSAMSEISESSDKIAEIIGVIDEIAFQTNLLALNASVEAARAGEQGRGFAVVATEVRNLAQRSATAAREIKDLIQDSVGKVRTGSDLVNHSGQSLTEIVEGVKQVGEIIAQIAIAGREQSDGIKQVVAAVNSMDEMTQHNAALAEETSAASVSMNEQAHKMSKNMDFFKL